MLLLDEKEDQDTKPTHQGDDKRVLTKSTNVNRPPSRWVLPE